MDKNTDLSIDQIYFRVEDYKVQEVIIQNVIVVENIIVIKGIQENKEQIDLFVLNLLDY